MQSPLSQSVHFSLAQEQDATALVRLINSGYRGDESRKGWTTEADFLDGIRIDVAEMVKVLRSPDSVMLKAESSGEIFGCVYLMNKGSLAYLGMLTVKPTLQGLGLGKQLIAHAERHVKGRWGLKQIEMTVITLREELIRFYDRQGYQPTGEKRPFPYSQINIGDAKRSDLEFIVLAKNL